MSDQYQSIPLINNAATNRFEITVDGAVAFIEYKQTQHAIALLHTEVPKEMEGRGIAGALVEKTRHYIEKHHLRLIPLCPYVVVYLKRHPEWNRLVAH